MLVNSLLIGTAAMIPFPNSKIELAKMTVQKEYRGKGLSKILLRIYRLKSLFRLSLTS